MENWTRYCEVKGVIVSKVREIVYFDNVMILFDFYHLLLEISSRLLFAHICL